MVVVVMMLMDSALRVLIWGTRLGLGWLGGWRGRLGQGGKLVAAAWVTPNSDSDSDRSGCNLLAGL